MWRLLIFISIFLAGCTIPGKIFFRNYSKENVRLQATLVERRYFDKLPNKVNFYDTATKRKEYCGNWKYSGLVTWVDTTTFYINVPPFTVVDIADISRGLVLGARQPDIILLTIIDKKVDTLMTGEYFSFAKKFLYRGYGLIRPPIYYYDIH
jgi:hypothetical protein